MHKTFQIYNLGWFEAPQSFKFALILGSRNRREKNQIKNCCAGGSAWDPVVTDVPIVL